MIDEIQTEDAYKDEMSVAMSLQGWDPSEVIKPSALPQAGDAKNTPSLPPLLVLGQTSDGKKPGGKPESVDQTSDDGKEPRGKPTLADQEKAVQLMVREFLKKHNNDWDKAIKAAEATLSKSSALFEKVQEVLLAGVPAEHKDLVKLLMERTCQHWSIPCRDVGDEPIEYDILKKLYPAVAEKVSGIYSEVRSQQRDDAYFLGALNRIRAASQAPLTERTPSTPAPSSGNSGQGGKLHERADRSIPPPMTEAEMAAAEAHKRAVEQRLRAK